MVLYLASGLYYIIEQNVELDHSVTLTLMPSRMDTISIKRALLRIIFKNRVGWM